MSVRIWQTSTALALAVVSGCQAAPPLTGRVETETVTATNVITDTGAGAQYTILVRLPPSYDRDPSAHYPVVYQLDALFLDEFNIAAGIASQLAAAGSIPEPIVVGVGHPPGGSTPDRDRDFTLPGKRSTPGIEGHCDRFYTFLRDELVPHIDARYRTNLARGRTLIGHSNGGAFALYAFLQYEPGQPALFDNTIAADFGYNSGYFALESALAARTQARPGSLYLTRALFNGAGQQVVFEAMVSRVASRNYTGLRFSSMQLETDHAGAIAGTIEPGLRFSFGGAQ